MVVNREKRRGYKNFIEHMNYMDKSMKRHIIVEQMDDKSKQILADFLEGHNKELWDRSTPELRESLTNKNS